MKNGETQILQPSGRMYWRDATPNAPSPADGPPPTRWATRAAIRIGTATVWMIRSTGRTRWDWLPGFPVLAMRTPSGKPYEYGAPKAMPATNVRRLMAPSFRMVPTSTRYALIPTVNARRRRRAKDLNRLNGNVFGKGPLWPMNMPSSIHQLREQPFPFAGPENTLPLRKE